MRIVKSVGVLSAAKILGMLYGCIGLIFVPFALIIALAGSVAGGQNGLFAGISGVVLAIFLPLLYGAFGFVGGLIAALLYNLVARWVGGVEVELEEQPEFAPALHPSLVPPPSPTT